MQHTNNILMIRPAAFGFNVETAVSNSFQNQVDNLSQQEIIEKAKEEFDGFVNKLHSKGINVWVVQDSENPIKPDAIFPNNWISMHPDGTIYLYPMCTPNRRLERRLDIIAILRKNFEVTNVKNWGHFETEGKILEGTGSMVMDHIHKIVYACLSPRTDKELLEKYAQEIGYEALVFRSLDKNGGEVYHTNVVMCMGEGFAVICLDSVPNQEEKQTIIDSFTKNGNEIIAISLDQMNHFAGNMLQVHNVEGKSFLVMSKTAFEALNQEQVDKIEKYTEILPVQIDLIEKIGGGSARCMMAEIYCDPK